MASKTTTTKIPMSQLNLFKKTPHFHNIISVYFYITLNTEIETSFGERKSNKLKSPKTEQYKIRNI